MRFAQYKSLPQRIDTIKRAAFYIVIAATVLIVSQMGG